MKYQKLNTNWNADPNCPEPNIFVEGNQLRINFRLNSFQFDEFEEGDNGELIFYNCCKYSLNECNDEGYFREQYRYTNSELPWGEFYKVESNWEEDFPKEFELINIQVEKERMNHYIFFFRDNTFECVAEGFELLLKKE